MKIRIVSTVKYIVLWIFVTLTLCVHIDGNKVRRSITNSSIYLQSCGDEIDQWNCNENDGSSEERCVHKCLVCDGHPDCYNNADEQICPKSCGDCGGGDDGFECYPGGDCFPCSFVCDGDNDCSDWQDEADCGDEPCKPGYFRCESGRCIDEDKVCDGYNDCPDDDDEAYLLCRDDSNSNDEWYITLVVIGVLLFLVVLCSVVTTKYRRVRRNGRRDTGGSSRGLEGGRTSISMEMNFPPGPPSYEATMSATMSINPAYADVNSINSSDIPVDDDLPPPYESIGNDPIADETYQSINEFSTHPAEPVVDQNAIPQPNSESTQSPVTNNPMDESSSSSQPTEPFYEPSTTLDDGGRHI